MPKGVCVKVVNGFGFVIEFCWTRYVLPIRRTSFIRYLVVRYIRFFSFDSYVESEKGR